MSRLSSAVFFTLLALAAAMAQDAARPTAPQNPSLNVTVSGTVKDSITGKPLANYSVSTNINATWVNNTFVSNSSTKEVKSTTDESGRYKLSDLPPGNYRISARDAQH